MIVNGIGTSAYQAIIQLTVYLTVITSSRKVADLMFRSSTCSLFVNAVAFFRFISLLSSLAPCTTTLININRDFVLTS